MKRVEKDLDGGWIARGPDGEAFYDDNWRWNSRDVARSVARELHDSAALSHGEAGRG